MRKHTRALALIVMSGLLVAGCDGFRGALEPGGEEPPPMPLFHTASEPLAADLIAGGGNKKGETKVGEVLVWNDADYLYVKYDIWPDWCATETHLHVADQLEAIPQKNGNPRPGQFEYKTDHDPCLTGAFQYAVPLVWPVNTRLYIGAHAAVTHERRKGETAWGRKGCEFAGRNWATCIVYDVQGEIEWPEDGRTTVAFEDEPRDATDWDYNDWVANIDVLATYEGTFGANDLTAMLFTVLPRVRIAGFTHVMHLGEDTFRCDGTYELYRDGILEESGVYLDGVGIDVVLVPNTASPNTAQLRLQFDTPCDFDLNDFDPFATFHGESLFFDSYLFVNDTGEEVHQGDPRMLSVPTDWQWVTIDGRPIWLEYQKVGPAVDETGPVFVTRWWE